MVLFPPPFYFVFDISNLLSYIQKISNNELAHPVMGTIFIVIVISSISTISSSLQHCIIGERAKQASHSQVCLIENRDI